MNPFRLLFAAAAKLVAPPPSTGEATGSQAKPVMGGMLGQMISQGDYETYRTMRKHPTIALARAVVMAPILSAEWSVEPAEGQDVPEERLKLIEAMLKPMRPMLVREALAGGLDYGWQPWEKVWDVRTWEGKPRLWLSKLKPLLHDQTQIELDKDTGKFAGLRQGKLLLDVAKCLIYTHDGEAGDLYGRPRLENVRDAWDAWRDCEGSAKRYDKKVAGVQPVIHYPPGQGRDKSGQEFTNSELALRILTNLEAGKGLAVPNDYAAHVDDRSIGDKEKRRWLIELLEDKGSRQPGFVERQRYLDSLLFRGMLRPERSALEGQNGTKAEAGTHGDVGLLEGQLLHEDIVRTINWHAVDQVLVLNYGEEARGSVVISPGEITDSAKAIYRQIVDRMAASPAGLEVLRELVDFESIVDRLGLPANEYGTVDATADPEGDDPAARARAMLEQATEGEQSGASAGASSGAAQNIVEGEKLNGAQIQAASAVIDKVIARQIPVDVAIELLIAVGIDEPRARRMVQAAASFKPDRMDDQKPSPV